MQWNQRVGPSIRTKIGVVIFKVQRWILNHRAYISHQQNVRLDERRKAMSDQNLVVRKSFDFWNAHDAKGYASLLTEDYVWESDNVPSVVRGPKATADLAQGLFNAFPDSKIETQNYHDAGVFVITQWCVVGTHLGEFMGI